MKKTHFSAAIARLGRFRIREIARALQASRSNLILQLKQEAKKPETYHKATSSETVKLIEERLRGFWGFKRWSIVMSAIKVDGRL